MVEPREKTQVGGQRIHKLEEYVYKKPNENEINTIRNVKLAYLAKNDRPIAVRPSSNKVENTENNTTVKQKIGINDSILVSNSIAARENLVKVSVKKSTR